MARIGLATERMIGESEPPIGWMVFNNPERRNAVSAEMWEAIPAILDAFEADPAIRVVALRGAGGKAFVAGLDISQLEERFATPDSVARHSALTARAVARIAGSSKPTIAMIEGYCIGAGMLIALNCDLRLAAEGARLAVPAAKMGLSYPVPGIQRLIELAGPAFAREMLFTARQVPAGEALAAGLIGRVLPQAELEGALRELAAAIADNAPLTLAAVKGVVAELGRQPGALDAARCRTLAEACLASADHVEGRRAFMDKRKPVFTGR